MNNQALFAQVSSVELNNKFDSGVEISSMVATSNGVILVAEKCKKIFCLDKAGNLAREISLNRGILTNMDVEIEGTSSGKNCLFFSDEKNARIYVFKFSDSSITEVQTDYDLSGDTGSYGMEGIFVDTVNNICYLLKEKNGNNQSVIHVFRIITQEGKISFSFIKNIFIEQPDNSWRFSDLCFNASNNYLYCLKTKYGSYEVDTISTKSISQPGDITINLNSPKLFLDFSSDVKRLGAEGYNTNMEGIALTDNGIYLVSDNAQEFSANCDATGKGKTLLMLYKQ